MKKISYQLHLYLGLLSGIIVFVVCITGCMYTFKDEINDFRQPWKFISPQEKTVLLPTQVLTIANKEINNNLPTAITYGEPFDAVFVDYWSPEKGISTVFINSYDGRVIKTVSKKTDDFDFFKFVLTGHRTLWLSAKIGKPIVGWGVTCFAIILITGLILWWPKKWNKTSLKRNFTLKRNASSFRAIFDLHNVFGGYVSLILLVLCFTGLIWSFEWFSKTVYYVTSGGKELKPYVLPKSDTTNISNASIVPLDKLFLQLKKEEPEAKTLYFALPTEKESVIRVSVVHQRGFYYRTDNLFFDQYTLQPLQGSGPYAGKYTEASSADKFRRMNLEIHDGRILGIFGKILVFIAGLTGASLPVTGMILWYKKRKMSQRKNR